ncbi:MAG: endospore germination permease [Tissierellaceae bacterium]|nr:endospore germination permease [Tissierellaceae bacterium]
MNKDPKISNIQIRALIVSTVVGVGVLGLPNQLANVMDKDGWIPIMLSAILIIPLLIIINKIFQDNPGKNYFEIGDQVLGKPIFTICLILYILYYVAVSAYIARLLGDLIKGFLLIRTPTRIIILMFLISISYVAISEIDVIARIAYITYPIAIIFGVLLVLLSIPGADFSNILPVFQSDLSKLPEGLRVGLFSFSGFEILLFAIPYAEEKEKVLKTSITAIIIVCILYVSLFFASLMQLSIKHVQLDPYPVLMIAKLIDLPGYFLQNLDGLVMAIWVIVIFSTIAPTFFATGKVFSKLFKTKSHTIFVLILIPVVYMVSVLPKSIVEMNEIMSRVVDYLSFVVILVIPLAILIVGRIRGRKKQ